METHVKTLSTVSFKLLNQLHLHTEINNYIKASQSSQRWKCLVPYFSVSFEDECYLTFVTNPTVDYMRVVTI